jgi:hypothetical protein
MAAVVRATAAADADRRHSLGASQREVEGRLGPPDLELREPADCTNAVYVLRPDIASA